MTPLILPTSSSSEMRRRLLARTAWRWRLAASGADSGSFGPSAGKQVQNWASDESKGCGQHMCSIAFSGSTRGAAHVSGVFLGPAACSQPLPRRTQMLPQHLQLCACGFPVQRQVALLVQQASQRPRQVEHRRAVQPAVATKRQLYGHRLSHAQPSRQNAGGRPQQPFLRGNTNSKKGRCPFHLFGGRLTCKLPPEEHNLKQYEVHSLTLARTNSPHATLLEQAAYHHARCSAHDQQC